MVSRDSCSFDVVQHLHTMKSQTNNVHLRQCNSYQSIHLSCFLFEIHLCSIVSPSCFCCVLCRVVFVACILLFELGLCCEQHPRQCQRQHGFLIRRVRRRACMCTQDNGIYHVLVRTQQKTHINSQHKQHQPREKETKEQKQVHRNMKVSMDDSNSIIE